jgi:hypothetical protein
MNTRFFISLWIVIALHPCWAQSDVDSSPRSQWGVSAGINHYNEPDLMQLKGPEMGLHVRTKNWAELPTAQLEADVLLGKQNYTSTSSGSMNGVTNLETRWRGLVPLFSDTATNEGWFTGMALHTLWNDLRGTTSFQGTTYGGYQRSAVQLWLPVRWTDADLWEVDAGLLLYGRHTSKLSEVSTSYSDVINTQRRGQYVQLTMKLQQTNGDAIRPFVRYTHLGDSNTVVVRGPQNACPSGFCQVTEPLSHRWQMGAIWEFASP